MIELEDHDHSHCVSQLLGAVEEVCQERGLRLTEQRRAVLEILAASHIPASAYDILDRMNKLREEAGETTLAPVSIYRALEFLMQQGFIHRIESRNAYVACSHAEGRHSAVTIFMLCDNCGRAGEFQSETLSGVIDDIAARARFQPHAPVMEIRGLCALCRDKIKANAEAAKSN